MLNLSFSTYFHDESNLTTLTHLINEFNTVFIIQIPVLLTSKMADFQLFTWLQTDYCVTRKTSITHSLYKKKESVIIVLVFLCIECINDKSDFGSDAISSSNDQSNCDESSNTSCSCFERRHNKTKNYFDKFQSILNKTVVNIYLLEEDRYKCLVSECTIASNSISSLFHGPLYHIVEKFGKWIIHRSSQKYVIRNYKEQFNLGNHT